MSNNPETDTASKCPACGWRVDADAYRCPKCLIYFCHRCRKRVPADADQFQCVNQQCNDHGKLLCSACTVMVDQVRKWEDTAEEIRPGAEDRRSWTVMGIALLSSLVAIFLEFKPEQLKGTGLLICWGSGFILFWVIAAFLSKQIPLPTILTSIPREETQSHRSCITCRQPVENLTPDDGTP